MNILQICVVSEFNTLQTAKNNVYAMFCTSIQCLQKIPIIRVLKNPQKTTINHPNKTKLCDLYPLFYKLYIMQQKYRNKNIKTMPKCVNE